MNKESTQNFGDSDENSVRFYEIHYLRHFLTKSCFYSKFEQVFLKGNYQEDQGLKLKLLLHGPGARGGCRRH